MSNVPAIMNSQSSPAANPRQFTGKRTHRRLAGALLLGLALPLAQLHAAPAVVDSSSSAYSTPDNTTVSMPVTVTSGANVLAVTVAAYGMNTIASWTLNWTPSGGSAQALSPAAYKVSTNTTNIVAAVFYVFNPASGTGTVSGTLTGGTSNAVLDYCTLSGVDTTAALVTNTNDSAAASCDVIVTAAANSAAVVAQALRSGSGTLPVTTTATSGTAANLPSASTGNTIGAGGYVTGMASGSTTITGNLTGYSNNRHPMVVAAFAPVTGLTVNLTSPTNNQTFAIGSAITATATVASGTAPYTVKIYTDISGSYAQAGGDLTSSPYQVSLGTPVPGTYHIYATVSDSASGTATSTTNTFTVISDQLPTVALTGPANGTGFLPGESIVIQATATDDVAVSRVDFYDGATLLGSDTTSPYALIWNGATAGAHTLTAVAVDSASQTKTSTAASVTVAADSTNTALTFNGTSNYVTMGTALDLGVGGPPSNGMTIECWFRKEGAGTTTSTGTGGVTAVPLFSKGKSEADGSNVDCDFFLGINASGQLAADFEAYPASGITSGQNYPVTGTNAAIVNNQWYHAAATYDGPTFTWKLYLDGLQVGTATALANAIPRYDSIQHFGIGTAMNSAGAAAGFFAGTIDEVRVWNYARTAAQINATKNLEITSATGLVGRFGMNEGTGTKTYNSSGTTVGTLTNSPVWSTTGFPSAVIRSASETFDSYANGTLLTAIDGGNAWAPVGTPYTVVGAGGVNGTAGVSVDNGSQLFNWKAQPFQWSTLATGTKVAISLDFQSSPSATFDDDRVGWTVDASSQTTSSNQLAFQLDTANGGMVCYWDSNRTVLNALSGIKASTWYRFNVEYTKLSASSAGIIGTLTELDTSGNPTGTPYVGTIADSSVSPYSAPAARFTSTYQWPSFKNYSAVTGNADNASLTITGPSGAPALPTVALSITGSPMAEAAGVATVTATLSATSASAVTVNLAFSGTATLTTDYTRSGTSITIPAGSTTGTITLTAVQDSIYENPNETIIVDIDTVTGATENGTQQVTATITDDDPAPPDYVDFTGGTYAQNFDSLGANANGTVSQTPVGWFVGYDIAAPAWTTNVTANDGTVGVDGTAGWNCGIAGTNPVTDRALSIGNSSTAPAPSGNRSILLKLKNNTGSAITSFTLSYDLEQWRSFNDATTPEKLTLAYSSDNSTWVDMAAAFNGTLPVGPGTNTARDGNDPTYRVANLGGLYTLPAAVPNGSYIYLRWYDTNESGTDGINGIDNFSFTVAATAPSTPVVVAPTNGATGVSTSPNLTVSVSDPNNDPMTVTFYGRATSPVSPGPDFTIVALPDTQFYSESYPAIFNSQTQWIADNRVSRNIAYATGEGDVVNVANTTQYANAVAAYDILHASGIPYGVPVGNHDSSPYTLFNTYFNATRFSGKTYYGGSYTTGYQNHYDLFSAGGMDFIVLSLEFNAGADANIMTWANGILAANSNRRAIVVTHSLLQAGYNWPTPAAWSTDGGTALFPALSANPNLFLMLCGHNHGQGRRHEQVGSRFIDVLLADYQSDTNGGNGTLRIMQFSPANNVIHVSTYSPYANLSKTDGDNQFDLSYTMTTQAPFTVIGTNTGVASGSQTSVSWPGLTAGATYEWYATASDGTNLTTGTTNTFTTQAAAPPPTVTLGLSGSPMAEAGGVATVTATLSAAYTSPVTVNLAFSGTATATTDYTYSSNSIVIPAGSTSGSITLTAVQDAIYENPNETIIVDIDTVTNGTENGTQQVTATIADDDPPPSGTTLLSQNFDSMGASGTTLPAGWTAGYLGAVGTQNRLAMSPYAGNTQAITSMTPVVNDGNMPSPDVGTIFNSGSTGSSDRALGSYPRTNPSGDQIMQIAIVNTTASPLTTVNVSYAGEQWRQSQGASSSGTEMLRVLASSTSATDGFSYYSSLDFIAPKQGAANTPLDGNLAENRAVITATITLPSAVPAGGTFYLRWHDWNDNGTTDHFLAIDDVVVTTPAAAPQPTVTLGLTGSPMAEAGGVATVTATLSAAYTSPVTVNLAFSGTATATTDYTYSSNSITIPAGSTTGSITLTAVQDSIYENPNETIIVDIDTVTNGTESGTQQVTATITDDDVAPVTGFTAYNDCTSSSGNPANTTQYTISNTTGLLKDFATGVSTGVTLTMVNNGAVNLSGTGGPMPNAGTDAYNTFNGKVVFNDVSYYGSSGWSVEARFTGLDPAKEYTFATSVNRGGGAGYTTRWSKFTLEGADSSVNASSTGVQVNSPTSVSFSTGENTANGYVAKWTTIKCGADGAFTVRAENDSSAGDSNRGYSFDGIMLVETGGSAPAQPTVTLGLTGSPMAEAGGVATVTATLSAAYTSPVTVNLALSGTATVTTDYTASGTSITIPAGSTTGSITLTAVQDSLYDPAETIIVDIDTVTNGTESGTQQVTATITDDDPAPSGSGFIAYNDCAMSTTTPANVTNWQIQNSVADPVYTPSGLLKDYTTGLATGVTCTATASGALTLWTDPSVNVPYTAGTDAATFFNGKLDFTGSPELNSDTEYYQYTFTGLDPNKRYEFVTAMNRASSGYTTRLTTYTISGATSFVNASSTGATVSTSTVANDTTTLCTGYNTVSGYVARWTNITASSGSFSVKAMRVAGTKAYGFGMFMLKESAPSQAQYVIEISVDGLGGAYLKKLFDGTATGGPYSIPNFMRLKNEGSSTFAAHCDNDTWETLPNHSGILTARPRDGATGHNWTLNSDPAVGQTLHTNKGSYIASIFDVAHDNDLRTGMYANKTKFSLFHTYNSYTGGGSYDAANGAADTTGINNGTNKVDNTYIDTTLGGVIVDTYIAQQKTASPNRFAFLHINEPDAYGHSSGWGSATWNSQVVVVDGMIGKLLKLIEQDVPAMAGKTAIILTADHGNQDNPPTGADRYTVPFFVWGPGVAAGADLYALNTGNRQVAASYPMTTYTGTQPIRNAEASNLALKMLGLGAIPGSTFASTQDLSVSAPTTLPTVSLGLTGSPMAEAAGTATVTATLSATYPLPVTVNLAYSGTATPTTDYTTSGASITIPAGSTTGTITLTAVQDAVYDPSETIVVDIDTVVNATENGTQQVTATITDDDPAPPYRSFTGAAITENFNGLGTAGTVITPLVGWDAGNFNPLQSNQPGPGNGIARVTDTSLVVDDGAIALANATASIYNFGTTGSSDRALGSMPKTASQDMYYQLAIKNDSGVPIKSFVLSYTGEQWASAPSNIADSLTVWFSDNNATSGFVTMGGSFTFTAPQMNLSSKLDGNAAANRVLISGTFTPATPIAPGNIFYIRWYDRNDSDQDDGIGIDDVSVALPPNQAPTFSGYAVSGTKDDALSIYPAKILAQASDPDGDALSLTQVFGPSAQGGAVALGTSVTYTPPAGYVGPDTFDVEISDARGATVRGTITVTLAAAPTGEGSQGQNQTDFKLTGGKPDMVFRGIPGRAYIIQRSTDLTNWSNVGNVTAGADGKIPFLDPDPPVPQAYYRTKSNPTP